MITVTQSVTQKVFLIDEHCDTIIELKKALLTNVNNGMICNFKIITVDGNFVRENKNNEKVNKNNNYMLVTVPIDCPHH